MPNSLGTLSSGLILIAALEQAVALRPALSKVTTDFSNVPALKDDVVRSRIIGGATVNDFGSAASERTDTNVSITLDGAKEVRHKFTAAEINSTNRQLINESALPLAEAIADQWMAGLAAKWADNSLFTNETVEAAADTDFETLTEIRKQLNGTSRKVPKAGRFGVVNSTVYKELLNDPLCNRMQKDSGADPIADGELRGVAGFSSIYEYPALPTTDNMSGFFGSKGASAMMVRPMANPAEVFNIPFAGNISSVSIPDPNDPNTPGLTVLAVEAINSLTLDVEIFICWLQGFAGGRGAFGQRLVTA